jgi:septal ring factor EnvC (AmiA/AmiB activator)
VTNFVPHIHEMIIGVAVALASGGLLGAWFTHSRDLPKARAEARNMDWQRFQTEIARLDAKITAQDKRITELEVEVANCHETKEAQALQLANQEREIQELRARLVVQERDYNE